MRATQHAFRCFRREGDDPRSIGTVSGAATIARFAQTRAFVAAVAVLANDLLRARHALQSPGDEASSRSELSVVVATGTNHES